MYIIPIKYKESIFYEYKLYTQKDRTYEVTHFMPFCKTSIRLTSFVLPNDMDAVSSISSSCTQSSLKEIRKDLETIIHLYDLEVKIQNTTSVELSFIKENVKFPYLIKYLNRQKDYPKNILQIYRELLKKGVSSDMIYERYTKKNT